MKIALGLLVLVSCAHEPARVANPVSNSDAAGTPAGAAGTPAAAARAAPGKPARTAGKPAGGGADGLKIDRSGSVEEQLARLQDAYDRNAEAMDFLNRVYEQQKAQQAAQAEQRDRDEPDADAMFAVNIADDIKAGQVDGPADAPVTIIKAFDFACPFCSRMAPTMKELVTEYRGKVRVVYVNLVVHPQARPAHLASCAAAKQGKYKQFKDAFWDKGYAAYADSRDPSKLDEDHILVIAKGVGLDPVKLQADMAGAECQARIEGDMKEMEKFHVNATPTFFVNGKHISGARDKDDFKAVIDEQLKIAEASGVRGADYYTKVVLAKGVKQFRSKKDAKP
jgi:protein-disulfide isomerase